MWDETRRALRNAVTLGGAVAWCTVLSGSAACAGEANPPLSVVATTPELGSLVRAVAGDQAAVVVLAKPNEDPHFVEAKPSYVKALNGADLYLANGMEMEAGYAPVLLNSARNPRVLPGGPGYVDASVVVTPLEIPVAPIDRSMGDVHSLGNPHYLLDPLNGLKVAALLRDVLSSVRPAAATEFAARYEDFKRRLDSALIGPSLAQKYDAEKLAILFEHGKLVPFLERQGEAGALGGWLGELAPYYGTKVVDEHRMWPYFAHRFGLRVVAHLEPKPGVPPTTKHLQEVVDLIRADDVPLILASAYYDPRHAELVASETEARIVRMANQAGSRPGTAEYLDMVNYNVTQLVRALRERG